MQIRDRIKELRRVKAGTLRPHPHNWRTHPKAQRDALCGLLAEVGYADALLARELPEEANKILATLDPLANLAEADNDMLAEVLANVDTANDAVRAMLDQMLARPQSSPEGTEESAAPPEVEVPEAYQVVIECRDEAEQQAVYERITAEGLKCRLLTL